MIDVIISLKTTSITCNLREKKSDITQRLELTEVCRLGQATVLLLFYSLVFDRAHLEVTDLR